MKKNKLTKLCAAVLVGAMALTTLVGCGKSTDGSGTAQEVIYNLGAETKTIDPALNNAVDGFQVISNAFEGLCKLDDNNKAVEGMAKSWEVSEDGLTYTFKLREDAKWSDGNAVTAKDFAYAWKRALDPKTAADYAFQLYYIAGAEEFNTGKGSKDALGIKVVDDYTLEVKLAKPTTYFLELTAFPTYMPLREDIVEADPNGWTQKPETYVSNGPFKLQQYNMKDSYVFVKNDNYYDNDKVKLNKLTFKMMTDEVSAYASLKNGELQGVEKVPLAEIKQGVEDGLVQICPQIGTYYYCINVNNNNEALGADVEKALENKDFRRALSLSIDRDKIVEITKGGETSAYSFVPDTIPGVKEGTSFATTKYDNVKYDLEAAKAALVAAGYPNGEGLPTLQIKYNSTEKEKLVAEAIQQMWAQIGVKTNLVAEEWAVFQDSRKNGKYEIARHGWVGDYVDPMTMLDLFITGTGNNNAKYANAKYDELIRKAASEADAAKREGYLKEAEAILMDDMPIIPIYYYTQPRGFAKNFKGYRVSPLGTIYFDTAYME